LKKKVEEVEEVEGVEEGGQKRYKYRS